MRILAFGLTLWIGLAAAQAPPPSSRPAPAYELEKKCPLRGPAPEMALATQGVTSGAAAEGRFLLKLYDEKLKEILARREFQALPREAGERFPEIRPPDLTFPAWLRDLLKKGIKKFGEWLGNLFRRVSPFSSSGRWVSELSRTASWALGIGAAAFLLLFLWTFWRRGGPARSVPLSCAVQTGMPDALAQPAEAWERFAEEFVRKGEWRLALRAIYLSLLSHLHHHGAIRYAREKTNGEYVAALLGTRAQAPFRELTLRFDHAWYGNKPFDGNGYKEAVELARTADQQTRSAAEGTMEGTTERSPAA